MPTNEPICLATLSDARFQTIFDQVARHLLTQMRQSISVRGSCVYRSEDGLKCAVGILISDKEYRPDMEGLGVHLVCCYHDETNVADDRFRLLRRLQTVHDKYMPNAWRQELLAVASPTEFDLDATFIREEFPHP